MQKDLTWPAPSAPTPSTARAARTARGSPTTGPGDAPPSSPAARGVDRRRPRRASRDELAAGPATSRSEDEPSPRGGRGPAPTGSPGRCSSAPPGLRGAHRRPGPNRMNRAVVIRAAAGPGRLPRRCRRATPRARRLHRHEPGPRAESSSATTPGTTPHAFARDTAAVLTAAGRRRALLLPVGAAHAGARLRGAPPRRRRRRHGHREPQPAGGQRLQGLPRRARRHRLGPGRADRAALRRRDRGEDRRGARPSASGAARRGRAGRVLGPEVLDAYLAPSARLADDEPRPRDLRIVAHAAARRRRRCRRARAARRPASPTCSSSPEQAEPDPAFPTVAFPNPEEPGRSTWRSPRAGRSARTS